MPARRKIVQSHPRRLIRIDFSPAFHGPYRMKTREELKRKSGPDYDDFDSDDQWGMIDEWELGLGGWDF